MPLLVHEDFATRKLQRSRLEIRIPDYEQTSMPARLSQKPLQDLLRTELTLRSRKNPSYSLRAFAARLGIEASALSQIIRGKRNVSLRMAGRILDKLDVDQRRRADILGQLESRAPDASYTTIDQETFSLIADWYHFAILSLVETTGFNGSPDHIAERLGIGCDTAADSVDLLISVGLLTRVNDQLMLTHSRLATSDDIPSHAISESHRQKLALASEAIKDYPPERRDFTALTMAINVDKLPAAKAMIREFKDRMSELLESPPKSEVYQLCVQLFPLTDSRLPDSKQ